MTQRRFATYAWGVLAFNLAVILWGAYVRATGSGAGCGSHWPLCDGAVVPRSPRLDTVIEFAHRTSSGLALLLVVGLFIGAFRIYPKGHRVRRGATFSMVFIITEALLGAWLVLFGLVGDNASIARAISIALHLSNTFLLLAALTITAHWASGGPPVRLEGRGRANLILGVGLLGVVVLGMSGAVTALGDTLFPAESVSEGLRQELDPTANFMVRLRVVHPVIAVAVGFYLFLIVGLPNIVGTNAETRRFARMLVVLFVVQLGAGVVNVLLLAPVWMQLLHLLLADLTWITLVLLAASSLAEAAPYASPSGRFDPSSQAESGGVAWVDTATPTKPAGG
jgi:heme A synthase